MAPRHGAGSTSDFALVIDFGEEKDLPPQLVTHSMETAAAKLNAEQFAEQAEQRGGPLPDEVFNDAVLDYKLTLFKGVRDKYPEAMSEELKMKTSYLDRELKRKRKLPTAEPSGEA